MRKRQISKALQDETVRFEAEVIANSDDRPGLSTDERIAAVARDNAKVEEWLAKQQHPATEWTWTPQASVVGRLNLAIISLYERDFRSAGNPAFVWTARQKARELSIAKDAPGLQWIEDYIDATTEHMAGLVNNPPKVDAERSGTSKRKPSANDHIAEALGFAPRGRGESASFSDAQLRIRNWQLGCEVLTCLPRERYKEDRAVQYVAEQHNIGKTTVGDAWRLFKTELDLKFR